LQEVCNQNIIQTLSAESKPLALRPGELSRLRTASPAAATLPNRLASSAAKKTSPACRNYEAHRPPRF